MCAQYNSYSLESSIEMNQKALRTHKNRVWNRTNERLMKKKAPCVKLSERICVWREREYFWVCDHSTHNYIQWRPSTIAAAYTRGRAEKNYTKFNSRVKSKYTHNNNKNQPTHTQSPPKDRTTAINNKSERDATFKNYLNTFCVLL